MMKYIAFLRAINVGGHTVKMDNLRRLFESMGFSNVETFIASGNVLFNAKSRSAAVLEQQIEKKLKDALGYEVAVFTRTDAELKEITNYRPFPQFQLDAATAFNIAFLKEPPGEKSKQKVMTLHTDIDDFHIHDRELYWLCKKKQSESAFSNAVLERTLGKASTIRGVGTIKKIAAKCQIS